MKREKLLSKPVKVTGKVKRASRKMKTQAFLMSCILLNIATNVMATGVGTTDPNAAWTSIMTPVVTWVSRLGIIAIAYGGIEMGLANTNEDANQKTRAGRFIVGGAIVLGIMQVAGPMLTA